MATTIMDAAGLDNIRNNLAEDYILGADIDLSSVPNWVPIGDSTTPFTGTLDFAGFAISNLTINRTTADYVGLFGYCRFNDALKIPNIKGGTISGTVAGQDYVGLLAGYIVTTLGSTGEEGTDPPVGKLIDAITGAGTVDGRSKVGGILGMAKGPQFAGHSAHIKSNSYSPSVLDDWIAQIHDLTCSANVTGSGDGIGGIVGELYEIAVEIAKATGTIAGGDKVGGIAGSGYRCAVFHAETTGSITGTKLAGGIIGYATTRSIFRWCKTEGAITGTGGTYPGEVNARTAGVGGIAGYTNLEFLTNCVTYGNVTAVYRAGGLVGSCDGGNYSSPNVYRCYARGDVSVSGRQVGGLFGFMFASITEIDQCYCTGSVTGSGSGALIGTRGSYIEYGEEYAMVDPNWDQIQGKVIYISDCFYNSTYNTASNQYGGVAKTDAEMRLDVTYETSDEPWEWYDRFWIIDDEEGDYYPQLLCFYDPYGLTIDLTMGPDGLMFSYLKDGELFYKQFEGVWGESEQVPGIVDAQTMTAFRTKDEQLGWVVDENGRLKYILDNAIHNITAGYYGNILDAEDEAFLLYVTNNGAIAQLAGQGDWPIAFTDAKPLSSDSQVNRLRAGAFRGYAYAVWRSRGQHRMMVLSTAGALPEVFNVKSGTITMNLDSPVVSVTLELDKEVTV